MEGCILPKYFCFLQLSKISKSSADEAESRYGVKSKLKEGAKNKFFAEGVADKESPANQGERVRGTSEWPITRSGDALVHHILLSVSINFPRYYLKADFNFQTNYGSGPAFRNSKPKSYEGFTVMSSIFNRDYSRK